MESKIYTKTGDKLTTSLPNRGRVSKGDDILQLLGAMDELNSQLGVVRAECECPDLARFILRIQENILKISGAIACNFRQGPGVEDKEVQLLEKAIDNVEMTFVREKRFHCPGETLRGAHMDVARTVARRAERLMAVCEKKISFSMQTLQYINRLSDYLYVLARQTDSVSK